MTIAGLLLFASVYAVAVATPGPGVAGVLARVLARGPAGIGAFIAGSVLGDLVWFTIAATGLAAVAQTFQGVFLAIKYAGVAYLLYLAYRLWTAPAERVEIAEAGRETGGRLFLAGLLLILGNPKTIVFFLALLPTVVDLPALTPSGAGWIALTIAVILPMVFGLYAWAAARARRLFSDPRAIRRFNRGTAAILAGTAAAVAAR